MDWFGRVRRTTGDDTLEKKKNVRNCENTREKTNAVEKCSIEKDMRTAVVN